MMKTKTKLKRENRKRLKTKMKMPKQQNLSLNESANIQYGAHECYGHTAMNPRLIVDGIQADDQHVFVSRFDKTGTKLTLKNNWKTETKTKKINQNENHTGAEETVMLCFMNQDEE